MKDNLSILTALIKKELIQLVKDPGGFVTAFIFPLLLLFMYGTGVSLDMEGIRIGIVAEQLTPQARGLIQSLQNSRYFNVVDVSTYRQPLAEKLLRGDIRGYLVIPQNFLRLAEQPATVPTLQILTDGSEPNTAKFVKDYLTGHIRKWWALQGLGSAPKIEVETRVWYNEELESSWFLIPGSIAVILTVTGALLTALVVAREWERGTMEALMASPVSMLQITLSKFITYFLLCFGSLLVCLFVATLIYQVPFRGSWLGLLAPALSYMFFALEMGLFISILTKNQFAASQAATITAYLPAFMLSGFIFDIDSMALPIRLFTYLLPARYFVTDLKTLFLVGDVWEILIPNSCIVFGYCALIFLLIAKKNVKRLDV